MLLIPIPYYISLALCVLILFNALRAVDGISGRLLRTYLHVIILFAITRYISATAFALSDTAESLRIFSHFLLATSIVVPLATLFSIWYLYPQPKIPFSRVLFYSLPAILFYLVVFVLAPVVYVQTRGLGYAVDLISGWKVAVTVVSGMLVIASCAMCIYLAVKTSLRRIRVRTVLLGVSLLLLALDLALSWFTIPLYQPFIVSEALFFIAFGSIIGLRTDMF